MIKGLLEQYNIPSYIQGELLQGGMGELPMADLVTVSVQNEHEVEAKKIVQDWQAGSIVEDESNTNLVDGVLNGAA